MDNWSVFKTDANRIIESAVAKGNQRLIRNKQEIDFSIPAQVDAYLTQEKLPSPSTYQGKLVLAEYLLCVCSYVDNVRQHELEPKSEAVLRAVRNTLLSHSYKFSSELAEKLTIELGESEIQQERQDVMTFETLLHCVSVLSQSEKLQRFNTTPLRQLSEISEIFELKLCPPALHSLPLKNFMVAELVSALKWIESKWLNIRHSHQLSLYLDLLMNRAACLCMVPQQEAVFCNISDYKNPLDGKWFVGSQRMLEDLCWSFVPMYRKLNHYAELNRHSESVVVEKSLQKQLQEFVVENALEMEDKDTIEMYAKTYMNCSLRPSEWQKYKRDFAGKPSTTPRIVEALRGLESKQRMMENLSHAPWIIIRERLVEPCFLQILYLLLIDSVVSNIVGFSWMSRYVLFNVQLLEENDIVKQLNRSYPLIVQDFNHFNVYYREVLYRVDSAAKSFIHWLRIMDQPPFNGKIGNASLAELRRFAYCKVDASD
jgi:hypothetical protein